jgi:hypothetical protein
MQTTIIGYISTDLTYMPAGQKADGTKYNSNVTFNVAINHKTKTKSTDFVKMTVWGSYGDMVARSFKKGSWFCADCTREPNYTFQKRNASGTLMVDQDGKPVMGFIEGYQVNMVHFPPESYKHVKETIAAGVRKAGWDVEGSTEQSEWNAYLTKQRAEVYVPGSPKFGNALVKGVAQTGVAKAVVPQNDEEAELLAAFRAKKAAEAAEAAATVVQAPAAFVPPAPVVSDDEVF